MKRSCAVVKAVDVEAESFKVFFPWSAAKNSSEAVCEGMPCSEVQWLMSESLSELVWDFTMATLQLL